MRAGLAITQEAEEWLRAEGNDQSGDNGKTHTHTQGVTASRVRVDCDRCKVNICLNKDRNCFVQIKSLG